MALWGAVLAAAVLISGYAVVQLAGRSTDGPPTPPPGADDPLNRPVLIGGGTVMQGNPDVAADTVAAGPRSIRDEVGVQATRVPGFWMQEHEVTNQEYRRFDAGHRFPVGQERHPVVHVTWGEALAYAASRGGTLPTEWQWEYAARGTASRKYPWGTSEPTCQRAHFAGCDPESTIAVMSRPGGATPEDVHDLAGNVWEWVAPIWFKPGRTPLNHETPRSRGGSFADDAFFVRASNRNCCFYPWFKGPTVGFRVVWPLDD